MPARPLTRAQACENRRFLKALADTGNARLAARSLGLNRSTFTKRRAKHAGFAQSWEAALAAAHAKFHLGGGPRVAELKNACGLALSEDAIFERSREGGLKSKGGEPTIIRRANGKLQLRLALPGQLTRATEQAFLRALSATANIRLSAKAAGVSYPTIYKRKNDSEAFRREWKHALAVGYDRLELAALEAGNPDSDEYDDWLHHNDLPPIPPMSAAEALQLLALHRNGVKLSWDEPHRRKRRNETHAQYGKRLFLMWRAEQRNLAHERAAARGEAYERTGSWRLEGDWAEVAPLPALETVTGWSKAKPKGKHVLSDPERPSRDEGGLFGGWTIEDWHERREGGSR